MKTIQNSRLVWFLVLAAAILTLSTGCDSLSSSGQTNLSEEIKSGTISNQELKSEAKYMVSYMQTTSSYSTRLPERLSESLEEGSFILQRQEKVQQTIMIDRDGYINMTTEWVDGSADEKMPHTLSKLYSNGRPAPDVNHKPVTRSEMANGLIRYFSEEGDVLYEYPVDQEQFKLSSRQLDELLDHSGISKNLEADIEKNIAMLQEHGVNVERKNDHIVELSHPVTNDSEVTEQRQQMDVRIGKVTSSVDIRSDGNIQNRSYMKYKNIEGIPILENSMTEHYGEKDGQWTIAGRTVINREDIQTFIQ